MTPARVDAPLRGIVFLVVGIAIFSVQDVIIRWLKGAMPIPEFVFLRSAFSMVPLAILIAWEGGIATLGTRRLPLHLLRGGLLLVSYHCYFLSILLLPLAEAVALFFAAPLCVTFLSIVLLGERVDARRWTALVVGFLGVVIIVRPGTDMPSVGVVFGLASTLTYAFITILTRHMGATEGATAMVATMSVVYLTGAGVLGLVLPGLTLPAEAPAGLELLMGPWVLPTAGDLGLLALCGLVAIVGFYCLVQAYRLARVSVVAPFEYTGIVWGVVWGFAFWREVPDAATVVGILVVAASGVYILGREQRSRRADATRREP